MLLVAHHMYNNNVVYYKILNADSIAHRVIRVGSKIIAVGSGVYIMYCSRYLVTYNISRATVTTQQYLQNDNLQHKLVSDTLIIYNLAPDTHITHNIRVLPPSSRF